MCRVAGWMLCGLAVSSVASAADVQVSWSGRLLDSAGAPLNGPVTAEIRLYAVDEGGVPTYSEPFVLDAQDGFVSVVLGAGGGLGSGQFQQGPVYVAVAVGSGSNELTPRGLITHTPLAASAAGLQLGVGGDCDADNVGVMNYQSETLQLCTADGWREIQLASVGDGSTAGNAGASCEAIHTDNPLLNSGLYWIAPDVGGEFIAYCDMTTYGGGWTLVVKANNGDSVNFYGNHTILSGSGTLNATTERDSSRGDYIGEAFSRLSGSEMLLRDCVGSNDLMGDFGANTDLSSLISTAKGNTLTVPGQCGLEASGLQMSGSQLGAATITRLGLACEDDNDTTWVPDDDATVISWRDTDGADGTSFAHTAGIAKVGTDGGDDVQNRANAAVDACVMVFWR